jgi:hypothetical protein
MLAQPEITIPYIFNEDTANKNNKPKFISVITILKSKGITIHENILNVKVKIGPIINKK